MADPTTSNLGLIVPNTGSDVGSWGTAVLNANFNVIDGMFGGQLTLNIGNGGTTITLTTASATLTPSAGPYQSANSIITVGGNQLATTNIILGQPGTYRFRPTMGASNFPTLIKPANGTGSVVALPTGQVCHIGFDGVNCFYMDMPSVGSYMDLAVSTTPSWMSACTTPPWLACDGAIYNATTFAILNTVLGTTFGGNGITTFAVPDFRNRYFIPLDTNNGGFSNRVTSGGSGINGQSWGAAGGNELPQSHNHANTLTDPSHTHTSNASAPGGPVTVGIGGGPASWQPGNATINNATTGITINNATTGGGSSGNVPPGIVGGMRFIKT